MNLPFHLGLLQQVVILDPPVSCTCSTNRPAPCGAQGKGSSRQTGGVVLLCFPPFKCERERHISDAKFPPLIMKISEGYLRHKNTASEIASHESVIR